MWQRLLESSPPALGAPRTSLKAAPTRPSSSARPPLPLHVLAARHKAQRKLLATGPLLEDKHGQRVSLTQNSDPALDHQKRPLPQLAQLGALDESEASLASANHESGTDELSNLPGSAGNFAEPAIIERTDGNTLGRFLPLHDPSGAAMRHFYRALADLRQAPKDAQGNARKVRVVAYGASHTQADVYTGYLCSYLQDRFGNAGHGYISLVQTNRWYRHNDYAVKNSRGWIVDRIQKRGILKDGQYGLLGSSGRARSSKNYARVEPRRPDDIKTAGSQYTVSYLEQPRGGHFLLLADGNQVAKIRTSSKRKEPGYFSFDLPLGAHNIEVKPVGNGEVRVLGVTIERNEPGVVVDTLGLSGTRASNQLEWDEASWSDALQKRNPDLYILAFGTNEATDAHQPIAT